MATRYIPLADAARLLGCSPDAIRRKMRAGELHGQRELRPQGYRWLVAVDDDPTVPAEASYTDVVHIPPPGADLSGLVELVAAINRLTATLTAHPPPPPDYLPAAATLHGDRATLLPPGAPPSDLDVAHTWQSPARPWWQRWRR